MKKKLLATAVAVAVGGAVLGGMTQAANITEMTVDGVSTLTICDDNDSTHCISIMDRNLGATTNDISSTGSYGNHYQWGNNYGFSPFGSLTTSDDQIDCSSYGPTNPFSSSTFIIGYTDYGDYCETQNNNLWGGGSNSSTEYGYGYGYGYGSESSEEGTVEEKKGPCDEGYHVPSEGEWKELTNIWAGSEVDGALNSSQVAQFKSDFKIPFAGYRSYYDGEMHGGGIGLWSSSPHGKFVRFLYMYDIASYIIDGERVDAYSVRCFKNYPVNIIPVVESGFKTTIGNSIYDGIPNTATITTNTISKVAGKNVYGSVNIDFGTNTNVTFNQVAKILIPVQAGITRAKVMVKHGGSNTYNYDGLTTNSGASCSNGQVVSLSDRYDGEIINVVDGYIPIYTCSASSFVAISDIIEATVDEIGTITICDENDSTHCITMMDRNLGATEAGTGCVREGEDCDDNLHGGYNTYDACYQAMESELNECIMTNTGVYGNHYQWGNNYGFSPWESVTIGNQKIDCSGYGPSNPFSNSIFFIRNWDADYCLVKNGNLWGDTINTVEARRGPCDEGYHVPSTGEWNDLINIWAGSEVDGVLNSGQVTQFMIDFKIPFAGRRYDYGGEVIGIGWFTQLWSSSRFDESAGEFYMGIGDNQSDLTYHRPVFASSIRCFKDTPVDLPAIGSEGDTGDRIIEITGEVIEQMVDGINTLTICGHEYFHDTDDCITMMDRNVGATEAGTGCIRGYCDRGGDYGTRKACDEAMESELNECIMTNSGVYGNHYQWGNNHGFSPWESVTKLQEQIDCSPYGPHNPFSGNIFYTREARRYCETGNNNLWGGEDDDIDAGGGYPMTNASDRQGPCPEGYHVPSRGEWQTLKVMWIGEEPVDDTYLYDQPIGGGTQALAFQSDFKIPFAGRRMGHNGKVDSLGSYTYLWSSSPDESFDWAAWSLMMSQGGAYFANVDDINSRHTMGYSVRCFKDTPIYPRSSSIDTGDKAVDTGDKSAEIYLTVAGGDITIGTDTGASDTLTKNLGELNISNNVQTITGDFGANAFWVEDMKGNESGYYTTLSVSDMIGDTNSGHIIPRANIQLKPSGVTRIDGAEVLESKVVLGDSWNDWTNNSWTGNQTAVTYFNRQNTATADAGRVGRWGDNLQIKVTVPAHTVADTYRGTLTYTLYEL